MRWKPFFSLICFFVGDLQFLTKKLFVMITNILELKILQYKFLYNSQTWVNDQIVTTCLHQPPFWFPHWKFYCKNDLCTTTTCQQRALFLAQKGGRCTQVWLYISGNKKYCRLITIKNYYYIWSQTDTPGKLSLLSLWSNWK